MPEQLGVLRDQRALLRKHLRRMLRGTPQGQPAALASVTISVRRTSTARAPAVAPLAVARGAVAPVIALEKSAKSVAVTARATRMNAGRPRPVCVLLALDSAVPAAKRGARCSSSTREIRLADVALNGRCRSPRRARTAELRARCAHGAGV